jgi:hypothetical protein
MPHRGQQVGTAASVIRDQVCWLQERVGGMAEQLPLLWRPRLTPRKFGKVLPGEVGTCRQVLLLLLLLLLLLPLMRICMLDTQHRPPPHCEAA